MKLIGLGVGTGKASGFARVIHSYEDVKQFKQDEILVTTITDPTMVPAMNMSAGIICSSGGLMSHPSITSREMGIPCVVQAQNQGVPITEVVETGDFVSFCGESGEITIEKRLHWVRDFISGIHQLLTHMHPVVLRPIDYLQLYPLFADFFVEKLQTLVAKADEQRVGENELAKHWPTTGSLRIQLLLLLSLLKSTKLSKETRMLLANFYFSMLQHRSVGNVHGVGENRVHSDEDILSHLQNISLEKGSPKVAKLLGKLANTSYNLAAGLYTDNYVDYAVESEGPYDVSSLFGENHILVIRRYVGLKSHIWPEVLSPINNLVVYCVFKDVEFSCDMSSCHTLYKGDVTNGLVHYTVIGDGKKLSVDKLELLLLELEELCVTQWKRLLSLSVDEQKKKIITIKLYGMRNLFDAVGMNWRPSKDMLQSVKKPLKEYAFWGVPERNQKEYWSKVYDPHDDFHPPGVQ